MKTCVILDVLDNKFYIDQASNSEHFAKDCLFFLLTDIDHFEFKNVLENAVLHELMTFDLGIISPLVSLIRKVSSRLNIHQNPATGYGGKTPEMFFEMTYAALHRCTHVWDDETSSESEIE